MLFRSGYSLGTEAAREEFTVLEQDLHRKTREMELNYKRKIAEIEPFFAELTGTLVEKITGVLVEEYKETIFFILHRCLSDVPKSNKYIVHLCKEDLINLEIKKQEFKQLLHEDAELEMIEDTSLRHNECIVETDGQIIDCSLDTQLSQLRTELRLLAKM